MTNAQIGQKAPLFSVSDWVQGGPTNFDQLAGKVVLVEIFQVNCPGCFLSALPQAIDLYQRYSSKGLMVLGIATAFEDFDLNTLENLVKLIDHGEVIGETFLMLNQQGILEAGRLPYRIPFPLAMDKLIKQDGDLSENNITTFIDEHIPNFEEQPATYREKVLEQVRAYLQRLEYRAETFEMYSLKGTPSHILVDKQGILRDCAFGSSPGLEKDIQQLLQK